MHDTCPRWAEEYLGGTPEAEREMIEQFTRDIRGVQTKIAAKTGHPPDRTFHAKILAGIPNALLVVDDSLPSCFAAGYFQPDAHLPVTVRFSNASPLHQADVTADMRGAALRIDAGNGDVHDLLMTSYPVSHARNAWQFIAIAKIAAGPKPMLLPRLVWKLGLRETRRVIGNIRAAARPVESLAVQRFWSRAPLLWGDAGPVRYSLRPVARAGNRQPDAADPDDLAHEFAARLGDGDVFFRLALQRYVDARRTPIEDGATEWRESDAPFVDVATLVVPMQNLRAPEAVAACKSVDAIAFNPWNCPPPFRPLGNLNRARRRVYRASAEGWLGARAERPAL